MSPRLVRLVVSSLLVLFLGAATAHAQFFNVTFQKASETDDSIEERVSGFPPARDCAVPCQTAHYVCRIINCSQSDVDGNCITPYPDAVTNGVFIDTPPVTLPIDCSRGVTVTGTGTWNPPVCDSATNTVRVDGINIPPGGHVFISFWCAIDCDEGVATNNATFDYDQNGSGNPRNAKDPLAAFGAPGLSVRVGNPSGANITKDAPSLPIQMNQRFGEPGTTVPWIIEATNGNCVPYTLSEIYDIALEAGCMSAVCDSIRLYVNDVPTALPLGTACPDAAPRLWTLGSLVIDPHTTIRIEFDGTFTRSPGPSACCNTAYFQVEGSGLLYSSDPGLEGTLNPEATCVDLNRTVGTLADAVKDAEDALGNVITTVGPGDEIYWHFTIENQGGADFTASLADTFPPEVTPGAIVTPFPTGSCTVVGQDLTCTGVIVPAASTREMVIRSTFSCTGLAGGAEICNEGTVTATGLPQPLTTHCSSCIGNPPFNRTCVTLEAPTFEFASKEVEDDGANGLVSVGEVMHYTIHALNSGTADATNVIVTDTLPAGVTAIAGTLKLDGVTLTDAADLDAGEIVAGVLTVRIPTIAPLAFGVGDITFDARLNTANGPNVCNGATITYDEAAPCGLGPQTVPDECIDIESVAGAPQLSSVKSVTPLGSADAGTQLHYSIGTCNGPLAGPATNVVVTDSIPANTTYVASSMLLAGGPLTDVADADAGTLIAGAPDQLRFGLGGLAAGQCKTVEFDVLIDAAATGSITNVGQFLADGVLSANTNSVSTPITVVTTPPDLTATKTSVIVGGAPAQRGGTISYTVRVCNAAAAGTASDVTIADPIPFDLATQCGGAYVIGSIEVDGVPQTDFADGDLARYDSAPAPGGIVVLVPTIAPGDCVDVTFDVTVVATCDDAESVDNTATASTLGIPSVTSNTTSDQVAGGGGTEICTGGVDEDGDGDIDCEDADCDADPACFEPNLMRKVGFPLQNRCTAMPAPCGCEVGNRLDPVIDDCITAGTCTQVDALNWTIPGDLNVHVPLVFYEINGAGCVAAGDPNHLIVNKSGSDILIKLVP